MMRVIMKSRVSAEVWEAVLNAPGKMCQTPDAKQISQSDLRTILHNIAMQTNRIDPYVSNNIERQMRGCRGCGDPGGLIE